MFAAADSRGSAGQLGHDELGIDTVGEHVAVVAVAGDDAVLAFLKRRLQPDRDGLLADVKVAEAADQAEAVQLPGLFLEAADEQHLLVEMLQQVGVGVVSPVLGEALLKAAELEISAGMFGVCCGLLRNGRLRFGGTGIGGSGQDDFLYPRPTAGGATLAYRRLSAGLATPRMQGNHAPRMTPCAGRLSAGARSR